MGKHHLYNPSNANIVFSCLLSCAPIMYSYVNLSILLADKLCYPIVNLDSLIQAFWMLLSNVLLDFNIAAESLSVSLFASITFKTFNYLMIMPYT